MIRQISKAELPGLSSCAQEFYRSSRFLDSFSIDRFREIWEPLLDNGAGVIFIDDRDGEIAGTMGGIIHREIYGEERVAEEMFWFVRQAFRRTGILLYRQFERWAIANSAARIQMVHLLDSMPEKVGRFYLREGFEPVETRYSRELCK